MRSIGIGVCAVALLFTAGWAGNSENANDPSGAAVAKGARWIASVQGHDGGWGQDGGETSYVRQGENLESHGNDVANTAVAVLALRRSGKQYQPAISRGLDFILRKVEASPNEGLAVTDLNGTQIQRKLGPYIDTFMTSMLLSEVDGTLPDPALNARAHRALEKCVAKIQTSQQGDGSWNVGGGWAPILGTSMASRSLYQAQQKGVKVEPQVMARADKYTRDALKTPATPSGVIGGAAGGVSSGRLAAPAASAGVALYQGAQALEQLSRTEKDRAANAPQINAIKSQLADARFVNGFGSIGGEEFFSYLNVSDGLRRSGGEEWNRWHAQITDKILKLQNEDGTWAGSHCITGRVAVTGAAILNLTVDREPLATQKNVR